jgi:hypothetical protein
MDVLLNNGWFQSIAGGLITAGLIFLCKFIFARRYSYLQAVFSIAVAWIVFFFGNILQPAVQYLLEGNNPYSTALVIVRQFAPGAALASMLFFSALAAIPTGLAVLRGLSFNQRIRIRVNLGTPLFISS